MDRESFLTGSPGNTPLDQALAALAADQYGLITTAQMAELGLDTAAVTKRAARGLLHRAHRGVYAVGHAALPQEGRWMAAVLGAGPGAALSHFAAATLLQAWRRRVGRIDVIAPRQRRVEGVRVHRCRRLDPRDITVFRGIPVTTMARTLVDLADELTVEQLANVIHEAAFHNRFDLAATHAAMERANGRRHLAVLERALAINASGSAGTKSGHEDRFLSLIRSARVPEPIVNGIVAGLEVDFHWPDLGLCVEVDGPGHSRPRSALDDLRRDRLLQNAGWTVVRVG